jgi:c-di-GMP-binding flagellar brake protein YcgR
MKKIVCPSCQKASYTAAVDANLPCPFCGFLLFGNSGLDRRTLKRVLTHNACEIKGEMSSILAQAVDISEGGVGVEISGETSFDKGDKVNVMVREFEIEKNATIIWVQKANSKTCKMGLQFSQ